MKKNKEKIYCLFHDFGFGSFCTYFVSLNAVVYFSFDGNGIKNGIKSSSCCLARFCCYLLFFSL
jgi:hypothetical protein